MAKLVALLILFVVCSFGQNCIKYSASTTLNGKLSLRDESGYRQYIIFSPVRAICVEADSKDLQNKGDQFYRKQSDVKEIQAGVFGSEPDLDALRDRLNRLIGCRVIIKGDFFPATTGYHRTYVQARIEAVDPVDAAGQRALLTPRVEIKAKELDAYDVTIIAGKMLEVEVHECGSKTPLLPSDLYAIHWMSGGDVMYVHCRDGYDLSLLSSTEKDGGICFTGELPCGVVPSAKNPVILKLRCTKKL